MIRKEINKEKILELKSNGLSGVEIAKILNVSKQTLYSRCKEYGVSLKKIAFNDIDHKVFLNLYKLGYNDREISEVFKVDPRRIQAYRASLNLKCVYKKNNFTNDQFQVFIGGMFGDSYLSVPKDSKNAYFSFRHSLAQEGYCLWKYEHLKNLCFKPCYSKSYHNVTNKYYDFIMIKSKVNKLFTDFISLFYKNVDGVKTKYINPNILYQLEPLGLAVWFMDDGFKKDNTYCISTNCFSDEDIIEIQRFFLYKYKIKTSVNKDKVIRISSSSSKIFEELIFKYIHKDCKYKMSL